ncbi:unnamed protein product [Heligmosomoides polygyrus]|uniref:NPH3 domain-containing protein n=1 Tax=Heligmosomoides polygyrus TaxID=6339 RepID=A0A183GMA3_HELPZ|nr:unnamed protein product [Heligmosomoides polygyrus]
MRTTKRAAAFSGVKCSEDLSKVLDYIDSLKYHDHVDYEFIYKCLQEVRCRKKEKDFLKVWCASRIQLLGFGVGFHFDVKLYTFQAELDPLLNKLCESLLPPPLICRHGADSRRKSEQQP